MRIVVVEDNISVAKGLRYYLEDAGHAVDVLHDGAEANAFLSDDGADIVILDINLPNMSGLDVLKQMRAREDMRPTYSSQRVQSWKTALRVWMQGRMTI